MRRLLAACALLAVAATGTPAEERPRRDLAADERRGGHTLARHVGRTDDQLRQRLRDQPDISAASTYTDLETAEVVVAHVLGTSADRVASWTSRRGARANLALRVANLRGPPIGRVLERGSRTPRPADDALVVLKWVERTHDFFVLTSYPENRE
jgi:Bacterial CdiA-CT RNAse A domain